MNPFSGEVSFDEASAAAARLLIWSETVHMAAGRSL